MEQRSIIAFYSVLMTLASFWSSGLQQEPTQIKETTSNGTSCPGYEKGNPSNRNMTGCETGTFLEAIDFEKAFGFNSDKNPDWSSCGLPRFFGLAPGTFEPTRSTRIVYVRIV